MLQKLRLQATFGKYDVHNIEHGSVYRAGFALYINITLISHLLQAMEDPTTLIAVASAVAALLSALYAASSARSTAKSLAIMQLDRSDKDMGLDAYLVDTALLKQSENKQRIVALAFTLTNLASVPNSISAAELHVYEYQSSGVPLKLILRPSQCDALIPWNLVPLTVPVNLDARSSTSGWLAFILPDAFGVERVIDKCKLLFFSAVGEQTSVETYLLKEVEYVRAEI